MTAHRYATTIGEKEACAVGRALSVSSKQSIELTAFVRGKRLPLAKSLLADVVKGKRAVPFRRFTNGLGHKAGMAAGRYPSKTASAVLKVIESAEANARNKGLNTASLKVRHLIAHKATVTIRYGRQGRHKAKRSHIEVVLCEAPAASKSKDKAAKKTPAKKEEKKETKQ